MARDRTGDLRGWWEACWRSDAPEGLRWAGIFIWGALVLLAEGLNFGSNFGWWDGWGVFLAGAGAIMLLEAAIRSFMGTYRAAWWALVVGLIILSIAFEWNGWYWVWSLVLATVGVAILQKTFARLNRPG